MSTADQIEEAVESFMPNGLACKAAVICDVAATLSEEERLLTEAWAEPRRQEYAVGRICARAACGNLQMDAGKLLPDAEGIPEWPSGSIGSITHSRGVALAVAGRADVVRLLGVDLEKTNRLSPAAARRVIHAREEVFAKDDQLKASILFSLKEAFYKAQYPRWRIAGNFDDLALSVDVEAGRASVLDLDSKFPAELAEATFAFRIVDDYVVSLCWL